MYVVARWNQALPAFVEPERGSLWIVTDARSCAVGQGQRVEQEPASVAGGGHRRVEGGDFEKEKPMWVYLGSCGDVTEHANTFAAGLPGELMENSLRAQIELARDGPTEELAIVRRGLGEVVRVERVPNDSNVRSLLGCRRRGQRDDGVVSQQR